MFHSSGPVVTAVLWILIGMSVITWAVVIYKYFERIAIRRSSRAFLAAFYKLREIQEIQGAAEAHPQSGESRLFRALYREMDQLRKHRVMAELSRETLNRISDRALDRALEEVREERQRFHTYLATVASSAPFIGLFGTVWGIMDAFRKIGEAGSASLAVVAPGISEALIATATGLFAAIPAVIFYNFFERRIEQELSQLHQFRLELMNLFEGFVFPDLISKG